MKNKIFTFVILSVLLIPTSLVSQADTSNAIFCVKAENLNDNKSERGLLCTIAGSSPDGSTPGEGESTENPSVVFSLTGVNADYFTRKSGVNIDDQPIIYIAGFELTAENTSTSEDWEIVIDRNSAPFNHLPAGEVTIKNGAPGWMGIRSDAETITLFNNTETMQIGAANIRIQIPVLEFNYDVPALTAEATNVEFVNLGSNASGLTADARIRTNDVNHATMSSWTTTIDASAFRTRGNYESGTLSLAGEMANIPGLSLTHVNGDIYTLSYTGNNQNYLVKGANAVYPLLGEDNTTGYITLNQFLYEGAAGDATYTNVEDTVTLSMAETGTRQRMMTYERLPSNTTTWSVDLDLKTLLDVDRSKVPNVSNTQFTLVHKGGDIYTLNYLGTGWPAVGGTLAINLPW